MRNLYKSPEGKNSHKNPEEMWNYSLSWSNSWNL